MPSAFFDSYVICTSPRSGSTLLCAMLKATGVAGRPGSHFHEPSLDGWLAAYDLSAETFASPIDAARAVWSAARARSRGGSDLFGLRLQRRSFDFFIAQMTLLHPGRASDVGRIEAAFGSTLFIHLRRADKLAQAVSFVTAEQSGLWHRAADGSELERLSPPEEPRYDRERIAQKRAEFLRNDADWAAWFEREGVAPLALDYDALASAPQAALARVLDALGLDASLAERIAPPTARLADATSAAWIERYRRERGT